MVLLFYSYVLCYNGRLKNKLCISVYADIQARSGDRPRTDNDDY